MAAPVYFTDLVDISSADNATDFIRVGTGNIEPNETDIFIVGTQCISKVAWQNDSRGIAYDNNANLQSTLASGNNPNGNQYVYIWSIYLAPEAMELSTPAGAPPPDPGYYVFTGGNVTTNAGGNWSLWNVGGRDTFEFGTAWRCYAIDFNSDASTADVNSGAGTNFTFFGAGANLGSAPTKGNPFAIDAIRRGSHIGARDGVGDPITFARLAEYDGFNGATPRVWGVFYEADGVYQLNTEVIVGDSSGQAEFTDTSGAVIASQRGGRNGVANNTQGGRNIFTFGNASSNITIENMTVLSRDANIDFRFLDNCTADLTACSLFGVRLLQMSGANQTLTRCTLPQKNVTISLNDMNGTNTEGRTIQNGATITSCTVEGTNLSTRTSGIAVSGTNAADLVKITDCNFVGDGRALLLGDISGGGEVELIYDGHTYTPNADGGYTDGATQASTAGPQGTSSAVIECNVASGTTLKITVQNTDQIPSVFNEGTGNVIIESAVAATVSGVLGNTEIVVLPTAGSPYSNNALNDTLNISTETVSANTNTGDGSSNYISYSNNSGFLQINAIGLSANFSNFPGVLQDTNASTPRNLAAGDKVRVTIRDDSDNPTLALFDEFEVSGTPSSASILTTTSFSGFTSAFGTTLNSANSKTVTVEKVNARFQFSVAANTEVDILAYRIGSNPITTLANTITNDARSFPLSQSRDRVYKNPA